MPIVIDEHRLAYFDVPKVASSTVKAALLDLLGRTRQADLDDGNIELVHEHLPTFSLNPGELEKYDDYWKFAVVRDPAKRILSVYSNRIVHHSDPMLGFRNRAKAFVLRVPLRPSLDEFVSRLPSYRRQSPVVRHHIEHFGAFLGDDLEKLDAVYCLENLGDLETDLSERTGREISFMRFQTAGTNATLDDLSDESFDALMDYTDPDYRLLAQYYVRPTRRNGHDHTTKTLEMEN